MTSFLSSSQIWHKYSYYKQYVQGFINFIKTVKKKHWISWFFVCHQNEQKYIWRFTKRTWLAMFKFSHFNAFAYFNFCISLNMSLQCIYLHIPPNRDACSVVYTEDKIVWLPNAGVLKLFGIATLSKYFQNYATLKIFFRRVGT